MNQFQFDWEALRCRRQFLVDVQTLVRRETDLWARELERTTQLLDQSGLDQNGLNKFNPDQHTTTKTGTAEPNQ